MNSYRFSVQFEEEFWELLLEAFRFLGSQVCNHQQSKGRQVLDDQGKSTNHWWQSALRVTELLTTVTLVLSVSALINYRGNVRVNTGLEAVITAVIIEVVITAVIVPAFCRHANYLNLETTVCPANWPSCYKNNYSCGRSLLDDWWS